MGAQGVPSNGVRGWCKLIEDQLKVPMFFFGDLDAYTIQNIYRTLKAGSAASLIRNADFSAPDVHFLGVLPEDVKKYDLFTYSVNEKDPVEYRSLKKAKDALANDPFFQDKKNKRLVAILEWLIKNKQRCEQQAYFSVDPRDPQIVEKIIIEKIKKGQKDKLREDLPKIVAEAKRVAAEQAMLNGLYLQPRPEGEARPSDAGKKGQNPAEPKPGTAATGGAPTPNPADAEAPGAGEKESAKQQKKLSEEAKALAARIRELSNKNPRVGHGYSENMSQVSENMSSAADAVNRRNFTTAGVYGNTSWHGISQIIAGLERILHAELPPAGADVAAEDYPKEFEKPISEYFRKLSYEE